jgi:Na+/proline symporter
LLSTAAAHPWWGNERMRTTPFWIGGLLLIAFAILNFLFSIIDPEHGNGLRGVVLFGTPLFPAMMGLVLIVAGFTTALLSRVNWDTPQPV